MIEDMGKGKDVKPVDDIMTMDNYKEKRAEMDAMMDGMVVQHKGKMDEMEKLMDRKEIEVDNDGYKIKVYISRPKNLANHKNLPAYIYAHGGGAIAGNAPQNEGLMWLTAINLQCIIFNVEYRLGPEVKAPGGQLDFAAVIRHVYNNADTYDVNKDQIVAAGISGGGWICFGACNQLTKSNEAHMVKA